MRRRGFPAEVGQPSPFRLAADVVEPVADERSRVAVTRARHRRENDPPVRRRLVGLERTEGGVPPIALLLTPRHVDPAVVGCPAPTAPRRRHPGLHGAPGIPRGIVFLHHVGVAGRGDVCRAKTSANHVNLPVDRPRERMISRRRHRAAIRPRVGRGVVDLVGPHHAGGPIAEERSLTRVLHDRGSANHVDPPGHLLRDRRAALARHRRKRPPRISDGIVFPRIVDRLPPVHAGTRGRSHAAAEHVDLAVELSLRLVMHGNRYRLLLGPSVGDRIVFVHHRRRGPSIGPKAADHVHLAAGLETVEFLFRFRKGCALPPPQGRVLRPNERFARRDDARDQERGHDNPERRRHDDWPSCGK